MDLCQILRLLLLLTYDVIGVIETLIDFLGFLVSFVVFNNNLQLSSHLEQVADVFERELEVFLSLP